MGEDRISLYVAHHATGSGCGSNLDTPRRQVREGRLFNVVLPDMS
jgi:hypothetical protein